ncbi:MAG: FkbM family methyltransferase [bacterium]|nr:FkbM family methyltransferase [bacterium]
MATIRWLNRFPWLATAYRRLRDESRFRTRCYTATARGFEISGNREVASDAFEAEEVELLASLMETVDVFVDIGANVGYYTLLARTRGVEVVAVEPNSANLRYLGANLKRNGFTDVEVCSLGLAHEAGEAEFWGVGGGVSTTRDWKGVDSPYVETVSTSTLDLLLGDRFADRRLLVKIDVEGAELGVLEGARETLQRAAPSVWMVETYLDRPRSAAGNPHFLETFELFWKHGFSAHEARPARRSLDRTEVTGWLSGSGTPPSANFLFTK